MTSAGRARGIRRTPSGTRRCSPIATRPSPAGSSGSPSRCSRRQARRASSSSRGPPDDQRLPRNPPTGSSGSPARARTSSAEASTCSGAWRRSPNLADLGWHGTEAVLLATGITGFLKGRWAARARSSRTTPTRATSASAAASATPIGSRSRPGTRRPRSPPPSSVTSEIRRLHPKYASVRGAGDVRRRHDGRVSRACTTTSTGRATCRSARRSAPSAGSRSCATRTPIRTTRSIASSWARRIAPDGQGGGYLGFTLPGAVARTRRADAGAVAPSARLGGATRTSSPPYGRPCQHLSRRPPLCPAARARARRRRTSSYAGSLPGAR